MPNTLLVELQNINNQIKSYLLQSMPRSGLYSTAIDNVAIYRCDENNVTNNCFYNPMVSIIIQGCKQSLIGSKEYRYGTGHYLITSVDVPAINSISQASPESPFLSIALNLDHLLISQLLTEYPYLAKIKPEPFNGIRLSR